jgi:hypothetical protein
VRGSVAGFDVVGSGFDALGSVGSDVSGFPIAVFSALTIDMATPRLSVIEPFGRNVNVADPTRALAGMLKGMLASPFVLVAPDPMTTPGLCAKSI